MDEALSWQRLAEAAERAADAIERCAQTTERLGEAMRAALEEEDRDA